MAQSTPRFSPCTGLDSGQTQEGNLFKYTFSLKITPFFLPLQRHSPRSFLMVTTVI